ncbi:MAG: serine hydrolase, partial [Anaerolineaceae bacterium]
VDYERQQVTAALGPFERRAVYREGLGCTVVDPESGEVVGQPMDMDDASSSALQEGDPWPEGNFVSLDELPPEVDGAKLASALDAAFAELDPELPVKTRAVVVVYDGQIIAERYAPGFSKDMPMISWSMAKSFANALVGILVGQGKLSLDEPAPVPEWSDTDDARRVITLDQLLRMSSGLSFDESYGAFSEVSVMLFDRGDTAAYAAAMPLVQEPDKVWHYSSGTSNIISRIARDAVGGTAQDGLEFPRQALFAPIGMNSAVFEPDAVGTFVGSSFVQATARDYARFGLLYLQDGVWQGERILPEGWVAYTTTPTPNAPLGQYGAQWWLNACSEANEAECRWPELPSDIFWADGHDGQFIIIVPSYDMVLVRLGFTLDEEAWDLGAFISDMLLVVPEAG